MVFRWNLNLQAGTSSKKYITDPKPFRPSTQFDGALLSPSSSQIFFSQNQYQSPITPINFVGASQPVIAHQQLSLPQSFGQIISPTSFVGQNVVQNQQLVGQNIPTKQQQTIFVTANQVSQQQTNFVEQNVSPIYRQKQQYPLTSTHSFGQTFVGQSSLPQPVQFFNQQQNVGQNFAAPVPSTQIKFFDQNEVGGENLVRESRHNYVFKNATYQDEDEEIDTPSDRIYRGWELDPHEFPWMVKLMVSNNNKLILAKNTFLWLKSVFVSVHVFSWVSVKENTNKVHRIIIEKKLNVTKKVWGHSTRHCLGWIS